MVDFNNAEAHALLSRTRENMLAAANRPFDSRTATDLAQGLVDVVAVLEGVLRALEGRP